MHWYRSKERWAVQDIDLRRVCFQVCVCAMCAYGTKSSRWGRWRARRLSSRMSGSLPCGYDLPQVKKIISFHYQSRLKYSRKAHMAPGSCCLKPHQRSENCVILIGLMPPYKLQGIAVIRRGRNTAHLPVLYFKVESVNERGFVANRLAKNAPTELQDALRIWISNYEN